MPELPEVETVRRGLAATVVGATIAKAQVLGVRTVRRQDPRQFERLVTGQRITDVKRRGKYLFVELDEGTLVCHLRMSGQLLLVGDAATAVAPHTHAVLALADGRQLRFVDPRTFGELCFCGGGGVDIDQVTASLGLDPLVDGVSAAQLAALCRNRRVPIKSLLLDQHKIAGIGNIYADEICFLAGVRPDRPAGSLGRARIDRLAEAIGSVLAEAVEKGGSSLRDSRYKDLFGNAGRFQIDHAVYARTDEPCLRCGRPIKRARIGGRSAHFCPRCQH